jgi:hypothetical protein
MRVSLNASGPEVVVRRVAEVGAVVVVAVVAVVVAVAVWTRWVRSWPGKTPD